MQFPKIIRYVASALFLYAGIAFLVTSCKSTATVASPSKTKDPYQVGAKSLLWEVSGNGLTVPSYLFGTIHIIGSNKFFWPDGTKEKLEKAERLVLEVNMDEMANPMAMFEKAKMKEGQTLDKLLSKQDYENLNAFFKKHVGMGTTMFNSFQPMLLMSMTLVPMIDGEATVYEQEITKLAKAKGMEMGALETVDFQISLFDKIPYEAQADMLMKYINDFDGQKKIFNDMIDVYVSQDIDSLFNFTMDSPDVKGFEDDLLDNRNSDWIPKMEKMAAEKATFFAVGAGHLGGSNGVIALLRKAGYEVKAAE